MQIFIANGTLQHRELHYRVPNVPTPRVRTIPAGSQDVLPDDLSGEALKNVILQLERLGAVPFDDLAAITKPNALLYRIQKQIESETIDEARALDTEARTEVAAEQMEASGLKAFSAAQVELRRAGVNPETLTESTITLTEVTDIQTVKDSVSAEFTVSQKPGVAGRKTTTDKRRSR